MRPFVCFFLCKLSFFLFLPIRFWALEMQPWFGDVFSFHFLSGYTYSYFSSVSHAEPALQKLFHSHVANVGLDFCLSPEWSLDADLQVAATTQQPFYFRSTALQMRYLWMDDIIGDPVSLATGLSGRFVSSSSLQDISSPYHGNVEMELNLSLGREFDLSEELRFRIWGFGALGHANRGSPWIRGKVSFESNIEDVHKFALYSEGSCGYGGHSWIDIDHFYGYGKIRQRSIDIGARYGRRMGVWGTLRFEYERRVLAKSCPARVNSFLFSYLLPFSL